MLNEDAKEKSKILDRLFKAESRNCELEQTVKTLNRRIEILEELTKTDHQKNIPSSIRNRETLNSTDEFINGVHEKVTRYILSKIGIEIDRLCEKDWSDKNKSESNQQEVSQEQDLQPLNNDPHGEKKTVHGMSNDVKSQQQQLPRSDSGSNHLHDKGSSQKPSSSKDVVDLLSRHVTGQPIYYNQSNTMPHQHFLYGTSLRNRIRY